jgi:hypothetical protein
MCTLERTYGLERNELKRISSRNSCLEKACSSPRHFSQLWWSNFVQPWSAPHLFRLILVLSF